MMSSSSTFTENLSLVLHKVGDLRLEPRPFPAPPIGNEVLLDTQAVGICGSDVHYWQRGSIGHFVLEKPMVMGHETSAVVSAVGDKVTSLKPGDRVAVEPGVPCSLCDFCKAGRYNLCEEMAFFATPPYDGSLCRQFKHPANFCFKLPDNVTFEEAALFEPLSVALHACRRAGVSAGSKLLILGAGTIGLMSLLAAKAFGATKVIIVDVNKKRLELAKSLGASFALTIQLSTSPHDLSLMVRDIFPKGADISLECSGADSCVNAGIRATRSGGCVMLIGSGPSESKVPLVEVSTREVDVRGLFRYANCYALALELVSSGRIDVKPLVTERYDLEQAVEAFEAAKSGDALKVVINCGGKEVQ